MSKKEMSRRDFMKVGSGTFIALGVASMIGGWIDLGDGRIAMAASGGYIVVDTKKCAGCMSCMLACSLTHHGKENLSLARLQIMQESFVGFPNDIRMNQCRQCVEAPCVEACPTGANHYDPKNGNVRVVDERKCIGCQKCVEACVQDTSAIIWNFEEKHAQKCDLCTNTPFWQEQGGSAGKQACVEVCPMQAVQFTSQIPVQTEAGYNVNLRGVNYGRLGLPTD